jgi:hypothetical protein
LICGGDAVVSRKRAAGRALGVEGPLVSVSSSSSPPDPPSPGGASGRGEGYGGTKYGSVDEFKGGVSYSLLNADLNEAIVETEADLPGRILL